MFNSSFFNDQIYTDTFTFSTLFSVVEAVVDDLASVVGISKERPVRFPHTAPVEQS